MRTAIVYDRVNKWGGAEKVLLVLHEIFPDAPLYTSVYDEEKATWAKVFPKIHTTFLQKVRYLRDKHELLAPLTPLAFESFDFRGYDLVISVTSDSAKGIITHNKTRHICYCLTPTRHLWIYENIYNNNPTGYLRFIPLYKLLSRPFIKYAKHWDVIAAGRPDKYIAISTEVKNRIKKYYKKNAKIIFPPIGLQFDGPDHIRKNYYLYVGRLESYKRVDLLVSSFNKIGTKLVVVGVGSELEKLKSNAHQNIEFKGFVKESKLKKYFQEAKALIMPQEEDFGLVGLESLAAGTPVIAYKQGGCLDYLHDGLTGVFFNEQNEKSLIDAVKRFDTMNFDRTSLTKIAQRHSLKRFKKELLEFIERG
jgi:glycosyltransferase involved in cell wall biosynthesis